ncbi:unnamed protein product [Peronospora destructor]|uniref:Uncharacterized protein n=1 Tax=Peronospora destructor TaxID=86335 RepID=A0AAV0VDI1_9STRA|nr:unnamed protein product [Peronospora destructor]
MAEDLSVSVSGRKHPRTPTSQPIQEPFPSLPFDTSVLPNFASGAVQEPQQAQNGGLLRTTSGLPLGRRMRLTLGQKREVVDLAASKKFTHRELAEVRVGHTAIA